MRTHFWREVSSTAKRAKLAECLAFLREGDVLTVTKPGRLARSTAELLTIEADLSKRGVGLVVLSMGGERLDTRNPTSKLMLTILAGVATWEREIKLERRREGIAKAKAARLHRCGTDQATAGRVGSRGDREASRYLRGVRSTGCWDTAYQSGRARSSHDNYQLINQESSSINSWLLTVSHL